MVEAAEGSGEQQGRDEDGGTSAACGTRRAGWVRRLEARCSVWGGRAGIALLGGHENRIRDGFVLICTCGVLPRDVGAVVCHRVAMAVRALEEARCLQQGGGRACFAEHSIIPCSAR